MKKCLHLVLFLVFLLSACEMSVPPLSDGSSILFQRPSVPENLKAESGYSDRINLSWDSVENATGYVVYGSRISEIGEGLKNLGVVYSNDPNFTYSSAGVSVSLNQSYVFSVVAMSEFSGSENTILYSDYSSRVEGSFAPSAINLHVVATESSVNAYWASPNLYSAYNANHESYPLYDALFSLSYHKSGESTWQSVNDKAEAEYLYESMSLNDYGLRQGEEYVFRAQMDIMHEDGSSVGPIYSNEVSVTISSNMIPDAIKSEDILVSQGERSDGILISWSLPSYVFDLSRDNTCFRIERSEEGKDEWTVLVDELSGEISERITQDADSSAARMIFLDSDVVPAKKYVYRIYNGVRDSAGVIYTHDEEALEESRPGYLFLPELTLEGLWSESSDHSAASVAFYINDFERPVNDLSYVIVKNVYHMETDSYSNERLTTVSSSSSIEYSESNSCKTCKEGSYHEYTYSLILEREGGELYYDFGHFMFNAEVLHLGTVDMNKPTLFRNLEASKDKKNRIVISWSEIDYDFIEGEYAYSYRLDGSDAWLSADSIIRDGNSISFAIEAEGEETIYLKAECLIGDRKYEFISLNPVKGNVLSVSTPDASDAESGEAIVIRWDPSNFVDNLSYSLEVSFDGEAWTSLGPIDYSAGLYTLNLRESGESEREKDRYFRINAENGDAESVVSSSDVGYVFRAVKDTLASKGTYIGKVLLSWTEVEGATGYDIYRYDGSGAYEIIGENIAGKSFYDSSPDDSLPYYAVIARKGDIRALFSEPEEKVLNSVLLEEKANMGYPFDETEVQNLSVAQGVDDESYILPYFTVSFKVNGSANRYMIYSEADQPFAEVNLLSLVVSEDDENLFVSPTLKKGESGYVEYDRRSGIVRADVTIGILDARELAIENVRVRGFNDTVSDNDNPETGIATVSGLFRRALTEYDYANLFLSGLREAIRAANSYFEKDWYGGTGASDNSSRVYTDAFETVRIENCYASFFGNEGNKGSVSFNRFESSESSMVFISETAISIQHADGNEYEYGGEDLGDGWLGYLGHDPLDMLNPDGDDGNSTLISPLRDYSIKGQLARYRDASISISSLSVHGTSGTIFVRVGNMEKEISITDKNILNKEILTMDDIRW